MVAMSSTCYNVFLYAWLNDSFRKELKRILPCFGKDAEAGRNVRINQPATARQNGSIKNKPDKTINAVEEAQVKLCSYYSSDRLIIRP